MNEGRPEIYLKSATNSSAQGKVWCWCHGLKEMQEERLLVFTESLKLEKTTSIIESSVGAVCSDTSPVQELPTFCSFLILMPKGHQGTEYFVGMAGCQPPLSSG